MTLIDGLAQDYSNCSASAMELPQPCAKPLIWYTVECRYNAVQFIAIPHTALHREQQNMTQTWKSHRELWSVCCEEYEENWPRYNGTALYYDILLLEGQEKTLSIPHTFSFPHQLL